MHSAEPPTEDDVTELLDGRRLESRESVEAWLKEVEALSGPPLDLNRLLEVLTRNDVDFVVVGGSAAGFLGASHLTEDADCVVRRERANLERLASALRELHA